jgi:hypothetical protein
LERNAALWQAASKRHGFVLFVVVKPCRLPTLSDHIRRCELFGMPEDAARQRFRDFTTTRSAPESVAFPGTVFAVSLRCLALLSPSNNPSKCGAEIASEDHRFGTMTILSDVSLSAGSRGSRHASCRRRSSNDAEPEDREGAPP